MKRFYNAVMEQFLTDANQMFFLAGPRQVGKTIIAKSLSWYASYLTWDDLEHQTLFTSGGNALREYLHLDSP